MLIHVMSQTSLEVYYARKFHEFFLKDLAELAHVFMGDLMLSKFQQSDPLSIRGTLQTIQIDFW